MKVVVPFMELFNHGHRRAEIEVHFEDPAAATNFVRAFNALPGKQRGEAYAQLAPKTPPPTAQQIADEVRRRVTVDQAKVRASAKGA